MVTVTFHSVSNPDGFLAVNRTCDRTSACDSYVAFCLRPIDTEVDASSDIFQVCRLGASSEVVTTLDGTLADTDSVTFNDTVFGLPNPVSIVGPPPQVYYNLEVCAELAT